MIRRNDKDPILDEFREVKTFAFIFLAPILIGVFLVVIGLSKESIFFTGVGIVFLIIGVILAMRLRVH